MSFLSDARIVSRALDRFLRESVQRGGRVVTQQPIEDLVAGLDLEGHALRLRGSDAAQLAARDALIAEGTFHLSTAELQGRRFLRAAFMNPDTSMDDVRRMIERVCETARACGTGR